MTKVTNCLARTSIEWFEFIINNKLDDFANFWKPNDQKFHVLDNNGRIYLYDSKTKVIVGVATFTGTSMVKDVLTAWNDYDKRNGQPTLQSFKDLLNQQTNTGNQFNDHDKICCIEVVDVKEFVNPIKYDYNNQQMFKKFSDTDEILRTLETMKTK